ncbi:ArsR family transcriptional regulator [Cupriavidus sp. SW-Y-13]|uniref:ArsR family transcriptional regulator n=2 Tax=unclassified Cupriavidus TaxID=2640874 RepID=UPI00351A9247
MTDMADDDNQSDDSNRNEDADDDLDPVLGAILQTLWDHTRSVAAQPEAAAKDLSLARLSKRASVQMSVLRRMLTQLSEADLVVTAMEEDGRGTARLTEEGEALCGQLFGEGEEGQDNQTVH